MFGVSKLYLTMMRGVKNFKNLELNFQIIGFDVKSKKWL